MSRRGAILWILCIAMPLAWGCAVQGQPFEKVEFPPNHAVIYVYRPYNYAGSLLRPAVTCGGESANIGPGGYHAYIVPAGKVTCSVAGSESFDQVDILAEPRNYYIKEEYVWGILDGHPHLNPIDTDTAHDEIESCVLEP